MLAAAPVPSSATPWRIFACDPIIVLPWIAFRRGGGRALVCGDLPWEERLGCK